MFTYIGQIKNPQSPEVKGLQELSKGCKTKNKKKSNTQIITISFGSSNDSQSENKLVDDITPSHCKRCGSKNIRFSREKFFLSPNLARFSCEDCPAIVKFISRPAYAFKYRNGGVK
jgi:hypothetical protein